MLPPMLRRLVRTPSFSLLAVLTLALGIGANTAVFTVVDSVLLEPLPYQEPERLVGLWHEAPGLGFPRLNHAPATYLTYREEQRTLVDIGIWDPSAAAVTGSGEPERVETMIVTDGTLPLLGVEPARGRLFTAGDDRPDAPRTAMISHGYWVRRFASDPGVLGEVLRIDGRPTEIIGVLPAGFRFLDREPDIYLPLRLDRSQVHVGSFGYQALGRMRPGVTPEQVEEDIRRMFPLMFEKFSGGLQRSMLEQARFGPVVHPLEQDVVGEVGDTLWVILGTAWLVLLIACANVANLYLVRADDRRREMAVRLAMGGGPGTLVRAFLGESLTLGLLGGTVGTALAWAAIRLLRLLDPGAVPRLTEIGLDGGVLLYTLGVSVAAGLLFGLFPLLRYSSRRLAGALREGDRGGTEGRERHRTRGLLVGAQVAMAVMLLVASGLMVRTFASLLEVEPGFTDPDTALTVRVAIPSSSVPEDDVAFAMFEEILRRLESIPGVERAAMARSLTMDGYDSSDPVYVEGFPVPEGQLAPIRRYKWVSPGYFRTMGNPLLAGRDFTWQETRQGRSVVILTEDLALEYFDSPQQAIGRRVKEDWGEDAPWREVIGVVGPIRDDGLDDETVPAIYWPARVERFWSEGTFMQRGNAFVIRSPRVGSPGFVDEVRSAVWSVDPDLPLSEVRTLREILADSTARTRFTLMMLALAAVVAMLLGAVGIYGVTSYTVRLRTREIGIRMALGADGGEVRRMVLRKGMLLTGMGIAAGLAAAAALSRLMEGLLYGVRPTDPLTYAGVALVLTAVAAAANVLPARRAARIDPVIALGGE